MVPVGRLTVMKIVPLLSIYSGDDLRRPTGTNRAITRPTLAGQGAGGI